MKKTFLLVAAFCASMAMKGYAQDNLALNKTAYGSTSAAGMEPKLSVDGDTGTRWAVNQDEEKSHLNGDVVEDGYDGYWYYVDLGKETDFNVIQIVWEGAYGKAFKIYTANDETDGKPNWGSEPVYVQNTKVLSADEQKLQTYKVGDQKARYVKIQATELGYQPYFSFWEFRVLKMDLTSKATNLNVSKETVKLGTTFTVNVTDQFGETMSDAELDVTNATKQSDGSYLPDAAGDIVIKVKGTELTKTIRAYESVLATATVSPAFIAVGQEQAMTVVGKDAEGNVIDGLTWTVEGATKNEGNASLVKAGKEGKVTFTLTDGKGHTATAETYAVASAADDPVFNEENDAWAYHNDITGIGVSPTGWNWGYEFYAQTTMFSNTMLMVTKAGTFGLSNSTLDAKKEYKTLNFDIFPAKDVEGAYLKWEGSELAVEDGQTEKNIRKMPKLEAGKWNHVTLDITGATNLNGWMQFYFAQGDARPDILLDNIYVSKNIDLGESKLYKVTAPEIVQVDSEFTLGIKDQYGKDFTDGITVEGDGLTKVEGKDNTYTLTKQGTIAVTVKSGDVVKEVSVFALEKATETKKQDDDYAYFVDDDTEGNFTLYDKDNQKWEGGCASKSVLDLNGDKVLKATGVKTFGFKKDVTGEGYQTMNFAIMPSKDLTGRHITFEGWTGIQSVDLPDLRGGEWNVVSVDISSATSYNGWIKFSLSDNNPDLTSDVDIFMDNVYLSKYMDEKILVGAKKNTDGFIEVSGYAKSAEAVNKCLQDELATSYDLSKLKIDGAGYKLTPANPNAIIVVDGTVENDVATPTQDWGDTQNLVVKSVDGFYFPVKELQIVDAKPVHNGHMISTKEHAGYKYTRQLPGNAYVSVCLPHETAVPEECIAYSFERDEKTQDAVALVKATVLAPNTPYLLRTPENGVELVCKGFGDLNFTNDYDVELGSLTVHGTYKYLNGDGKTQWALGGTTDSLGDDGYLHLKRVGTEAQIVPFRTYFTVNTPDANPSAIKFTFPIETGISNVEAGEGKPANIYSLDGRLVKVAARSADGLAKGVYIMNGKKFVVK